MKLNTCWARLCCAAAAALTLCTTSLAQTGVCCSGTTCTATTTGCSGNTVFLNAGTCSPNSCTLIGACCSGTTCVATTTGCASNGAFILNGACTPTSICSGACCASNGTCSLTSSLTGTAAGNCNASIGSVYLGNGTTCTVNPCVTTLGGGCCNLLTGACAAGVLPNACTGTSVFLGVGATCGSVPCVASVGACCAANGACSLTAPTACAQPSVFVAIGTACTTNPCTIPTGACCAADGTCAIKNASGTGTGACGGTTGDTYRGNDTACASSPCSQLTGSCCTTAGVCSIKTIVGCATPATSNQTFGGVGTTCSTNPCITGACCTNTGTCSLTTASGCGLSINNFGLSAFLGNGSTCTANVCFNTLGSGACCPNGANACTVTTPAGCGTAQFATYQGNGTSCTVDPCVPLRGACCATTGACTSTVALGCNGLFRGAGTTCTSSPCADLAGACCNALGACFIAQNAGGNGCTGNNTFRGAGTACTPDPCPAFLGACCSNVGSCTITILSGCTNPSTFFSVGSTCTSSPCPALRGACCSNVGTCSLTIASGCTGSNTFSGTGTTCSPNNCVASSGACCNFDTGGCTQTSASGCAGANVVWGAGISCNPGNPCNPQPIGACCIGTSCTAGTAAGFCNSVGGVFFFGNSCSPTPCVRPQIDISQIFPAGGETGAPYRYDYVELYNRGTTDVSMTNWSIQFGAQSTQTFPQRATFSGTILAGRYFLIQLASQNLAVGADLPVAPDWVSTSNVNLDVTAGRVALVVNSNALPNGCPQPIPVNIVDFVGYGAPNGANSPSCAEGGSATGSRGGNIYAFFRRAGGCQDTDNNGSDFITYPLTPNPRNSSFTFACGQGSGACCAGETCTIVASGACPTAPAGYIGDGTTCTPSNPCAIARGSCCTGSSCAFTQQAECVLPSLFSFGRACNPDPCNGACCTGTNCTFTSLTACTSPAYFIAGVPCSPSPCPGPAVVQSGDIAYGASVLQNQDAVQQIRGAGVANPTRVGTWARYNNLQIVRFDNRNGVLHNASGNLLAMDFGTTANGGSIFNMPTDGNAAGGSPLFSFTGPTAPFGLTRSRLGGLSVSPNNDRIACIGYDFARLYVMSYVPGATPGTGTGASIDGAVSTDNNVFVFGFNITQGTSWLDNNNVLMWVLSDQASVLKLYSVPVSGSGPSIALGSPVERLAVQDNKPNSSRFTSIAYNPQLIPGYIFLGASAFQSISLNSVYIVDITQPTWTVVKTLDLSGSLQTQRELAIGPDRNLYLCQFAGAGQQATDPLLDKITLDANADGIVTPAEIAALADNVSVDFYLKGTANTSSFNAIDIAIRLGACCSGTICTIQPPNFCTGGNGIYQGNDTACTPTNPCLAPTGVCCRGATCTNTITTSVACTGSLIGGQTAGATFPASSNCNSSGNTASPCCYANYNKTGGISVQDIFDFLGDWFAGSPYANTGGTGAPGPLSVQNIFDFLGAWFAGGC